MIEAPLDRLLKIRNTVTICNRALAERCAWGASRCAGRLANLSEIPKLVKPKRLSWNLKICQQYPESQVYGSQVSADYKFWSS